MLSAMDSIYGDERKKLFAEIDPKPLGSASLAQVHKARLADGSVVAVKIQRPGVRATMAQDIDIMRIVARQASRFIKKTGRCSTCAMWSSCGQRFSRETDFKREAANLQEFALLNKDVAFIACPKVYPELCRENILVMGTSTASPSTISKLRAAGYDLQEIGEDPGQLCHAGAGFRLFHADPHPGNMLVRDGKIVYIDLGMMGRLSRATARVRLHHQGGGHAKRLGLKDALLAFAIQRDNNAIDHTRFLADLDLLLKDYGSCDVSAIDVGQLLSDILNLTRQCKGHAAAVHHQRVTRHRYP